MKSIVAILIIVLISPIIATAQNTLPIVGSTEPIQGHVQGVAVKGDIAFISSENLGLGVYDISDPGNPQFLHSVNVLPLSQLSIHGNLLFGAFQNEFLIYDIVDPREPSLVQRFEGMTFASYVVHDTLLYLSRFDFEVINWRLEYYYSSLEIFSIPQLPRIVRYYNYFYDSHGNGTPVDYSTMVVNSGTLYAMHGQNDLAIWNVSNPSQAEYLGIQDLEYYDQLMRYGDLLIGRRYHDRIGGFDILSLDDPGHPRIEVGLNTPKINGCSLYGDHIYLSCADSSLYVYALESIQEPELVSRVPFGFLPVEFSYDDDIGIELSDNHQYTTIDMSTIEEPRPIATFGRAGEIAKIVKSANLLATILDGEGLVVSDCSDPQNIFELTRLEIPDVRDVAIEGDLMAVTIDSGIVVLYDISNPAEPSFLSRLVTGQSYLVSIRLHQEILYTGGQGLKSFNVTDPTAIEYIVTLTNLQVSRIEVEEDLLIALSSVDLLVYLLDDPNNPELIPKNYRTEGATIFQKFVRVRDHLFVHKSWVTDYGSENVMDVLNVADRDSVRWLGTLYDHEFPLYWDNGFASGSMLGWIKGDTLRQYDFSLYPERQFRLMNQFLLQPIKEVSAFRSGEFLFTASAGHVIVYDGEPLEVSDVPEVSLTPSTFSLSPFPNPFNSSVTITFSGGLETAPTRLAIYDISGRLVTDLTHSAFRTPHSTFGKIVWDASSVGAGVYFVRLEAGEEVRTEKIVLVR